jgi:hypothetical protein
MELQNCIYATHTKSYDKDTGRFKRLMKGGSIWLFFFHVLTHFVMGWNGATMCCDATVIILMFVKHEGDEFKV